MITWLEHSIPQNDFGCSMVSFHSKYDITPKSKNTLYLNVWYFLFTTSSHMLLSLKESKQFTNQYNLINANVNNANNL